MKHKSHMQWSWILMVTFLGLTVLDMRFGVGAIICMTVPLYQALSGKGKVHCSHYCPRGSFLGKFLARISLRNSLPSFMRTTGFKHGLMAFMVAALTLSLYFSHQSVAAIGMVLFRFIVVSSIFGIVLGIFYQPRSWCQICPMGHASGMIAQSQKNKVA